MKIYYNSGDPIYKQIAALFREDILNGRLASGAIMPSAGTIAKELRISADTAMKAYKELAAEGLISLSEKGGTVK